MVGLDEHYILPSHASLRSTDPLGICDEENPTVWEVITASISSFRTEGKNIHQLPFVIQDLSYSIKSNGHLDTQCLSQFLVGRYPDPCSEDACKTLDAILDAALSLPTLFPSCTIPFLGKTHPKLRLSSSQIACLLAHEILDTLFPPKGNTWGSTFTCWFSEPQALPDAVLGYLESLFNFFTLRNIDDIEIIYHYSDQSFRGVDRELESWLDCSDVRPFENLILAPVSTGSVPYPHPQIPCTLIASNQSPGFGPACTQEELVTAACPPLLPLGALLISPPVPPNAIIIAQGYVPLAHWKGQGREAHPVGTSVTAHHTFLFLDAAELDSNTETLPDLNDVYLFRDLHKAHTGFSALVALGVKEIASPIWGAGSFGGDPFVKTLILSAAAARTGMTIHLAVDEERFISTPNSSEKLILLDVLRNVKHTNKGLTVAEVVRRLQVKDGGKCEDTVELVHLFGTRNNQSEFV